MTTAAPLPRFATMADVIDELGGVPPGRILLDPPPGTATEEHVYRRVEKTARPCELVEGVLVEKAMGYRESLLAAALLALLKPWVRQRNLGLVTGEAGLMRLAPGLVRGPDVAFVSWSRIPDGCVPAEAIPNLVPDLAVEVLSESNTAGEMARKRREYFAAGTREVWQIDLNARTLQVFTSPAESTVLSESQTLDAGDLMAGFSLALSRLFGELDQQAP